jgi:hypothetical protein
MTSQENNLRVEKNIRDAAGVGAECPIRPVSTRDGPVLCLRTPDGELQFFDVYGQPTFVDPAIRMLAAYMAWPKD